MAIRRPSVYSDRNFIFQDFLYLDEGSTSLRYILGKYSHVRYESVSQTFDYPVDHEGGEIVSRIDYTLEGKLITIDNWECNWRDEWPLRLAVQYMGNCLYPSSEGNLIRVRNEARAFWVSEAFIPLSNDDDSYLVRN